MTSDERLAHALKLKFGLDSYEPTSIQLTSIKKSIFQIIALGRLATLKDWTQVVRDCCTSVGRYEYSGIDNSDLNTLFGTSHSKRNGEMI